MSRGFPGTVVIPGVMRNGDAIQLSVTPDAIAKGFVRVEVFPTISPVPRQNQYGFWDIDLPDIQAEQYVIWTGSGLLHHDGTAARGEHYRDADASRSLSFHISLWSTADPNAPVCVARMSVQSYFLATEALPELRDVWFPVTGRCNLACVMCGRTKRSKLPLLDLTFRDEDTPAHITDQVLAIADRLEAVGVIGFGEPLLVPGFFDLAVGLKAKLPSYAKLGLTSNGTLLDDEVCENILTGGIDVITFSIDGATPTTYERIRVNALLSDVLQNVSRLVEKKRANGGSRPELRASFVIMRQNYHEIVEFVQLIHDIGLSEIDFWLESESGGWLPEKEVMDLLAQAVALGELLGVRVNHHQCVFPEHDAQLSGKEHRKLVKQYHTRVKQLLAQHPEFTPPGSNLAPYPETDRSGDEGHHGSHEDDLYCPYMETLLIEHSGDINPCCNYWSEHTLALPHRFGNAHQEDISTSWNSETYRSFRERVVHQRWPTPCRTCPARRARYEIELPWRGDMAAQ